MKQNLVLAFGFASVKNAKLISAGLWKKYRPMNVNLTTGVWRKGQNAYLSLWVVQHFLTETKSTFIWATKLIGLPQKWNFTLTSTVHLTSK